MLNHFVEKHCGRVRTLVPVLILPAWLAGVGVASAQWTYQVRTPATTPTPTASLEMPAACKEDGVQTNNVLIAEGFVKTNTTITAHTAASVAGACDDYFMNTFAWTETRHLINVSIDTSIPSHYAAYPLTLSQSMDTKVPNTTSGPDHIAFGTAGEYLISFQTHAETLGCNFPATSDPLTVHVNAVKCEPFWLQPTQGMNTKTPVHVPASTITIHIPSNMWSKLELPTTLAGDYWSQQVPGLAIVPVEGGSCAPNDGTCAEVTEDLLAAGGCAATTQFPDPDTGLDIEPTIIVFPQYPASDNWVTRPTARMQRTMSHEMAHMLGLDHTILCTDDDSLMVGVPCDSTDSFATFPTENEILPVVNSVYGNGVRRVCGF